MKKCLWILLVVLMLTGCSFGKEKEFYVPAKPTDGSVYTEPVERFDSDEDEDAYVEVGMEEEDTSISAPDIVDLYYYPTADEMMNVHDVITNIPVELKYAGEDNFLNAPVYDFKEAFLRYGTIEKLAEVQKDLWEQGYSLKIWDAFRPKGAQVRLWNANPDERYVSNPATGALPHCQGNTVDVTLVDKQGKELLMPSAYDTFTEAADRDYSDVPAEAAKNAQLLEKVMVDHGFVPYDGEWWHFSDEDTYDVEETFTPGLPVTWVPECRDYISLRVRPDVHTAVLQKVTKGSEVTLLGWDGTFAKVDYEGQVGYVLANYIVPKDEAPFIDQLYDIQLTDCYSYDDMIFDMEWLMEDFSDMLEMEIIGKSEEGVDIPVLRVGNPQAEHHVLIQAGMHGREHATGWLMMGLIARALNREEAFLQDVCFHVIPMVNPDGVQVSQDEVLTEAQDLIYQQDKAMKYTKERKRDYASHWKANALGVDLNRNFPAGWEALENRDYPSSQWFGGREPFSASETKALRDYTQAHTFDATVSMHASGCLVYYGFGDKQPANAESYSLATWLCDMNGYNARGTALIDGGGYKDWAIDSLGIPSVTVEIGATIINDGSDPVPLHEQDLYSTFVRNARLLEALASWVMEHGAAK